MVKVVVGGVVGGILLFVWGYVAHMVIRKDGGMQTLPHFERTMEMLKEQVPESGVYWLATLEPGTDPKAADAHEKVIEGPGGLLVYNSTSKMDMPRQLGIELASNVLAALFASLVIASTRSGFLGRVLLTAFFGVVATLSITASHWNWYGFSRPFVECEAIDQVGGWLIAGIGIAMVVKGKSK